MPVKFQIFSTLPLVFFFFRAAEAKTFDFFFFFFARLNLCANLK
jgi:hypothetical protein